MLEGMVRKQTEKQAQTLDSWLEKHDREVPFPEGVRLHGDQDYMGDGKPCHRMDVYEPELNPKEGPVLVNFHGGGFLLGKKQVNRLFCADMCLHGFTVFCPEYPLVPEVGIFDIFRDLTVAVNRAGEEAAARGQDGVCLCGDSAGAYLCVYLAAMRENPAMAEAAGVSPVVPRIRALDSSAGCSIPAVWIPSGCSCRICCTERAGVSVRSVPIRIRSILRGQETCRRPSL